MKYLHLLVAVIVACALGHAQASVAMESADRQAIESMFDSYREAWAANEASLLEAHWDVSDPTPVYLAEEIDQPITDWDGLRAYWRHNEGFHEKVRLGFSGYVYKPLGDDRVMVVFDMRWDIRFRNFESDAMGGDNRVVTTLRRVDGQWRLTSWAEAPIAPIIYMRRLYERDVASDF